MNIFKIYSASIVLKIYADLFDLYSTFDTQNIANTNRGCLDYPGRI